MSVSLCLSPHRLAYASSGMLLDARLLLGGTYFCCI